MMKKLIVCLLCNVLLLPIFAKSEWKAYMAYHQATCSYPVEDKVYVLANGSIYTYQYGDTQVKTFSKSTGLGDCNITHMVYNEAEKAFLLIYDNYNIDVLGTNDSISHMIEYKNSSIADRTVNSIFMEGKEAYLATNSGIVVIDMKRRQFANTYDFGEALLSCAKVGKNIIASSRNGLWCGNTSDNLIDASKWVHKGTHVFHAMFTLNGMLYGTDNTGVFTLNASTAAFKQVQQGNYTLWGCFGGMALMGDASQVITMNPQGSFRKITYPNDFQHLSFDGEYYWACRGDKGLQCFTLNGDTLKPASSPISPNSPKRNLSYTLSYTPDHKLLVGGGSLNYTANYYPGTVMSFADEKWLNFQEDSIEALTGTHYWNVTSVVEDPHDATHHFTSAACGGVYEFKDGRFVHLYTHDNSPLVSILQDDKSLTPGQKREFVRVSGLAYDKDDNLWMLNNQVDTILRIRMADGSWRSCYIPELKGYPTFDKILHDSRGLVWITHRRTTSAHHAGILGYYHGETPGDQSDDEWQFRYSFTNQDNTTQTFNLVNDITEDLDGHIWIATNQGPYVLLDPYEFFESQTTFTQIKVPRNDGTDYADYLLAGVPITCIAVDGGNRKWFGTSENGVYLISADGTQTIHHFTTENSPLLSNNVYSIAINGLTGEVMMGTSAGLIGYRSDATDAQEPLAKGNLKIYPNPVRPDFSGKLRVDGLSFDSDVKITTTTGQVVAQGQSVGGTFTWDLRNKSGDRVSTGVYYVIASDQNGKRGAVGKFLVIK